MILIKNMVQNHGVWVFYTERNNWWRALERDQCLAIVAVRIVELINSSNKCSKFMRAAHSNLQRQITMYSHKKYVILQHLPLMRLIVDTRWAEGAKRLCFTCGARETQALNSLGPVH